MITFHSAAVFRVGWIQLFSGQEIWIRIHDDLIRLPDTAPTFEMAKQLNTVNHQKSTYGIVEAKNDLNK
jgi:hypothetical protein